MKIAAYTFSNGRAHQACISSTTRAWFSAAPLSDGLAQVLAPTHARAQLLVGVVVACTGVLCALRTGTDPRRRQQGRFTGVNDTSSVGLRPMTLSRVPAGTEVTCSCHTVILCVPLEG